MPDTELAYLVEVRGTRPLVVHFALCNPPGAAGPVRVPRVLRPAGAFVEMEVRAADGRTVWRTERPKIGLKLHPDRPESYLALEPGYTFGALLEADAPELAPGEYLLEVSYASRPYNGPGGAPGGELRHRSTVPFRVA